MSPDGCTIRFARASDVPEMSRLFAELGYDVPVEVLTQRLNAFHEAGEKAIVAEDASSPGDLLGLATLHLTPVLHRAGPVGRVSALVVDETMRGRGIGRALMQRAEQWAAERGCVLMEVTSNMRRADAHRFYETSGYERTSYRFAKVPRAAEAPLTDAVSHQTEG